MTESEARIYVAKNQNKILKILFNNIKEDRFDLNLDLSSIPPEHIDDFWVYTAGFLSVQNFEQIFDSLPDNEIDEILKGQFYLKELTLEEANATAKEAGKKLTSSGFSSKTDLYTIQDGTYSILKNKGVIRDKKRYIHCISLKTRELRYYSDKENLKITTSQMLHIVRNLIVHKTPYIKGSKLTFLYGDDEVEVTKMWLRGYSEMFSQINSKVKADDIKKILLKALPEQTNYLQSPQDIDKALSLVKNCFGEEIVQKYYRVNNFVKTRLHYNKDFYQRSLDEKIDILSAICANNPNFLISSHETMSPAIIYNLQQLVSKELQNRGLNAAVTEDDLETDKLIELSKEANELMQRCKSFDEKHTNINNRFELNQNLEITRRLKIILRKFEQQKELLETRRQLESSHMEIYGLDGLEHLPVEVAVNVVCMMGFNSLITSSFYEDLLAETNLGNFNPNQKKFFGKFNFSGITATYFDKKLPSNYTPEEKADLLLGIRNAICHNQITYVLPYVKQGETVSFKDAMLTFSADWDRLKISGKVIDFYRLFGSDPFTSAREKSIITSKQAEVISQTTPEEHAKDVFDINEGDSEASDENISENSNENVEENSDKNMPDNS